MLSRISAQETMKTYLFAIVFLLAANLLATDQDSGSRTDTVEMVTQRFRLPISGEQLFERLIVSGLPNEPSVGINNRETVMLSEGAWKDCLSQLGITWPTGSTIRCSFGSETMIVRNTFDNLIVLKNVLSTPDDIPLQVEVVLNYVQFERSIIDNLSRHSKVNVSTLLDLWQKKKGELLIAPRVLARLDQEVVFWSPGLYSGTSYDFEKYHAISNNCAASVNVGPSVHILVEHRPYPAVGVFLSCDVFQGYCTVVPGQPILLCGGYPVSKKDKLLFVILDVHLYRKD